MFKRFLLAVCNIQHDRCPSHVCADTAVPTGCILRFCLNGRVADIHRQIGVITLSCQLESTGGRPVASVTGPISFISGRFQLLFRFQRPAVRTQCFSCFSSFFVINLWHFKTRLDRTVSNPSLTVKSLSDLRGFRATAVHSIGLAAGKFRFGKRKRDPSRDQKSACSEN
jgi:hypothetical protein